MAAGMGIRLDRVGEHLPKGFTCVTNTPIVEVSVQRLIKAGVSEIYIVTGHQANYYKKLELKYPDQIRLLHNEDYENSGSMYSLFQVKNAIENDFLLLESDIIYEQRALTTLIQHPEADVILCSGETGSDDAVFITCANSNLVNMSKDLSELEHPIFGELVGISKISLGLFKEMIATAEKRFAKSLHVAYETDCMVEVASHWSIPCHKVAGLLWSEIDNAEHLQRARSSVYPDILKAEHTSLEKPIYALDNARKFLRALRKSIRRPPTMEGANYRLGRKMLLDVCQVFNEADIRYMVDQGTLIGIAREGDLLPWDDDVDIALPADQIEKVLAVLPILKSLGWRVSNRFMHYSFHSWEEGDLQCIKVRKMRWGFLRSRIRMDINIKYRYEQKYYWHSMGVACEVDALHFDDFDSLQFAGKTIRVPKNYDAYLTEKYGDWRTPDRDYVPRHADGTSIGRIAIGKTRR